MVTTAADFSFFQATGGLPEQVRDKVYVAPNNVAYVKKHVRHGLIPQLLDEFLQTRIMIKESSKLYRDNKYMQRILENRQMAIKLFMNVMYGYTGASFSGRMPCCDLADSVVESGRFILRKCISMIEQHSNSRVIYGDTGSPS